MARKNPNQILGILLLIAAGLMLVDIPFIDENAISLIIVLGCAIYNLIRK
ncbi:MAG: hypothetical protein WDZ77_01170 [Candidatus Pacearchaeota archaeon]